MLNSNPKGGSLIRWKMPAAFVKLSIGVQLLNVPRPVHNGTPVRL